MTVLDAYAVIAFMRGEPAAGEVAGLLHGPTQLTSINAAEVCDQMSRVFGRDKDSVEADLHLLGVSGMKLTALSPELAMQAGRLRASHYHRERCAVSLADCVAAAAALASRQPLATADPALAGVVRSERGSVQALPDSQGRRP